jgi:bacterioferritin (cytochrome b1)
MASKELLELLNKAIAREIQVSIQYMWQHVQWRGVKAFSVKDELRKIAVTEMKHAEGDVTTAVLFEKILGDEEEHHDFFTSLLEEI